MIVGSRRSLSLQCICSVSLFYFACAFTVGAFCLFEESQNLVLLMLHILASDPKLWHFGITDDDSFSDEIVVNISKTGNDRSV